MTPERWKQVKNLLDEALSRPPAERATFVAESTAGDEELRAELESLLAAADDAEDFLSAPAMGKGLTGHQPSQTGQRIGAYVLTNMIGEGGMGTVYRALRDDEFQQEVAIKLMRPGAAERLGNERFRLERQILAMLNHPGIARLLDGGSTPQGDPYLVMEYITGRSITEYCREQKIGLEDRLRLFIRVCEAVGFAHRNLVVHRDLKPSNILVTPDGHPKLLDFGIAKLVFPEGAPAGITQTLAVRLMTPDYASPEQIRGEPVTTATDVYSLGAILYELLTGVRAQRFQSTSLREIERVVCQEVATRPSSYAAKQSQPVIDAARLRGDVDMIVLKAMHKEPERRYCSVDQFADDLRLYLEGRPVLARPDTLVYRSTKFVQRNRGLVAGLATAVLALLVGIGVAFWQAHVAQRERQRAEQRFEDVRKLANSFLVAHDAIASLPGGTAARAKLVQRALEYLDKLASEAQGDRDLQQELATAYEKMGDVQGRADGPNVGDTAGALASYRHASAIRERLIAEKPDDNESRRALASVYSRLSGALKVAGDYKGGLAYDQKALALREMVLRVDPGNLDLQRQLAASYTTLGGSLFQIGDWPGVLASRRKALAAYETIAKQSNPTQEDLRGLTLALVRMGSIQQRQKEHQSALEYYRQAIRVAQDGQKRYPDSVMLRQIEATTLGALGTAYLDANQPEPALEHFQGANRIYRTLVEEDPNDARIGSMLAGSYHRMGQALLKQGQREAGLRNLRQALTMREQLADRNPANAGARAEVAESHASLGDALAAAGDRRQALRSYQKARELMEVLDADRKLNAEAKAELGRIRAELSKLQTNGRSGG